MQRCKTQLLFSLYTFSKMYGFSIPTAPSSGCCFITGSVFFHMLHCGDIYLVAQTLATGWRLFWCYVCVLVSESWRGQKGVPTNQPSLVPPSPTGSRPLFLSTPERKHLQLILKLWYTESHTHTSTHAVNLRCEKKMLCCVLQREGFALNSVVKVARDFPAFLYLQSQITHLQ